MNWFPPEDAERAMRSAEEMEADLPFSPMASRPTGRRLLELVIAHESRQHRLRLMAIGSNVLAIAALATIAAGGSLSFAFVAVGLLAGGLGASISAGVEARKFEEAFGGLPSVQSRRKLAA